MIRFAEKCGWTAVYLTFGRGTRQKVQFHLGVDPHEGTRPVLFGGTLNRWHPWTFRIVLPYVPWRWLRAVGYHPAALALYRLSTRFWRLFDRRSR
jgi:hypothetical protein